jgi:hypothetical protein
MTEGKKGGDVWIPAFAGMTKGKGAGEKGQVDKIHDLE